MKKRFTESEFREFASNPHKISGFSKDWMLSQAMLYGIDGRDLLAKYYNAHGTVERTIATSSRFNDRLTRSALEYLRTGTTKTARGIIVAVCTRDPRYIDVLSTKYKYFGTLYHNISMTTIQLATMLNVSYDYVKDLLNMIAVSTQRIPNIQGLKGMSSELEKVCRDNKITDIFTCCEYLVDSYQIPGMTKEMLMELVDWYCESLSISRVRRTDMRQRISLDYEKWDNLPKKHWVELYM